MLRDSVFHSDHFKIRHKDRSERENERERGSPPFTRRTVAISVTPLHPHPKGSPHCTYKKRDKDTNKKVMSYIDVN